MAPTCFAYISGNDQSPTAASTLRVCGVAAISAEDATA